MNEKSILIDTMNNGVTNTKLTEPLRETSPDRLPDDMSGVSVDAKIRIFDPESSETLFEGRA